MALLRLSGFVILIVGLLTACKRDVVEPQQSKVVAPEQPTEPQPTEPQPTAFSPPPVRLAVPARVAAMRILEQKPVGTLSGDFLPAEVPLLGVGLNRCQTGWAIQGLYSQDGAFNATHPFLIQLAEIPTRPVKYKVPDVPGHFVLNFSTFSEEQIVGEFAIEREDGSRHLTMNINGAPTGVIPTPSLAENGCFTTGYYVLSGDVRGPVTAVFDGKNAHFVSVRLSAKHAISVVMDMRAHVKGPKHILRADLERINAKPDQFPFRIFFEVNEGRADTDIVGPEFEPRQIAAMKGQFKGSFANNTPESPLRMEITNLQMPIWDGPFSGEVIDSLRIETLFYSKGQPIVPIPSVLSDSIEDFVPEPAP